MPEVIGLFLRSADNAFQKRLAEVGAQAARHHGFKLFVESVQFDSGEQVAQIRRAIDNAAASQLTAMLVSGVHDLELAPVAHEAVAVGLDWALLNDATFIDEVRSQHPGRLVFAATSDHSEIGHVHAQQIRALLGDHGRVLTITGNLRNVDARLRLEGLKQGLGGDFEVIDIHADWTSEGARRSVETWATGVAPEDELPDAFVAQNDEMALGVRQALHDLDTVRQWPIGDAPILGCDGAESFGQRFVREGRLKATVIMPPGSGAAIDWIARARKTREVPPARLPLPVVSFPPLARLKL